MRIFARPLARLAVSLAGTASLLAVAAPAPAEAAPLGRACMFVAPKGADRVGHAAFAIKVRGERDHWIYGSFGSTNDAPLNGWIKGGTWGQARSHFKKVHDRDHHDPRYYTQYRCVNTRDGNHKTAQDWYRTVQARGYNLHTNNCLHMSLAVFKGYSSVLRKDRRLVSATDKFPNWYFGTALGKAGWERAKVV
ncbi:hypothetical protein [Streptomyces olivochromogenes]|uniref:hypothetical protein n=1 Tax=Streptomyces olivochromogenes TaxID=1963 RepID=UPI003687C928